MALSTSGKFLKYVLVGFNVLVLAAGLFCLGFGAYIFVRLGGEGQISEVHAVPIFLIIVGIIVFLVGLIGCCGALVLDAFMLKAYACSLVAMLILEIIAAILVLSFQSKIKETVETYFIDAITAYENTESESLKNTLFTIQKTFGCCGGKAPSDWGVNDTLNFCCKGKAPCPDIQSQFTEQTLKICLNQFKEGPKRYRMVINTFYVFQGCGEAVEVALSRKGLVAGIVLLVLCIIQILAALCGWVLAKKAK
ncbi:unnamed protein product [Taenia asiatica]|uniref:Tetraspanin n=1 Tax=Taenia asiatica TaxID=60517 RepID=A0A0R3W967_TAEAS|nr:unnamed protein product [Taenia asiatica]